MESDIRFVRIILICILLKVLSLDAIVLRKGPDDKTVYEGDTVTFECIVASKGASQILWVFNGTRFISVDIKVFSYKTGFDKRCNIISDVAGQYKLQIKNVSKSDEGFFECYFSREMSTAAGNFGKSGRAKLTVLEVGTKTPICSSHNLDPPLNPYQRVLFNCSSASKNLVVKWQNGTKDLTGFQYGWHVTEIMLTPFDNGRIFTCTEINPVTLDVHNCSIKPMNIYPTAEISPRLPEITVNNDITFVCNASGLPTIVKYNWIHDGYVINQEIFYPMKYDLIGDGRTLKVRGVDIADNQSTIVCQAYISSGLYAVASTTMTVSDQYTNIHRHTNAPSKTQLTRTTITASSSATDKIIIEEDGYKPIKAFGFSLLAVIASVITICILILIAGTLLMFACNQKPASLDLPDITTRRGRSSGRLIPSVSGGISHCNVVYAELFNDIDFKSLLTTNECNPSLNEDDILDPLIDGNDNSFMFESHHHEASGLVAPPLPPKPTRLIAPDLYSEIPDGIYQTQSSPPPCDDDMLYCGTELSVRSSSEATDNLLPEPDEIYYQIPDRTSFVITPEVSDNCCSKKPQKWSRNPSPCGCDEHSRSTCPSYARVKKNNKNYRSGGLGNLERRLLIPVKCDDLTSAELYDVDFETELSLNEPYPGQFFGSIPEDNVQNSNHTMLPRRASVTCWSRLRRTKSCPKNNPYEEYTNNIVYPGSFISNLRVAESAPDIVGLEAQACCEKGHHVYETVPDKALDNSYKAKSDDILSKGSSDISCVDSSDYMNMECSDISDYI
ncbi:uncharacterized protein [Antedon mediterranea]|uniref:uncharacterized protein n=1 Tax=Antedon mediterranea TaxID=105859 RepID=UPI003AF9E33B